MRINYVFMACLGAAAIVPSLLAQGGGVSAPKITRPTLPPAPAAVAPAPDIRANVYTKKSLRVSVVQGNSLQHNEGLATGEGVLALSVEDSIDFPAKGAPLLEITSVGTKRRYFLSKTTSGLYETAPATGGPYGPNNGLSRIYTIWDAETQTLRLDLRSTRIDLGNGTSTPLSSPRADVFKVRVSVVDDDQKIWYHNVIVVHLEASKEEWVK